MYLQSNIHKYHKGTYQADRFPEALNADYVKIDERKLEDLIQQSATFSKFLAFRNENNETDGDWHEFFEDIYQFPNEETGAEGCLLFSSLSELEEKIADKPHLALLVSFLRLFKIEQDNLNTLTEKHLEFYYKKILGFSPKTGTAGNVTAFVQLNKNAKQAVVSKQTRFDAGIDKDGNPLFYVNTEDFIANKSEVSSVMGFSRINECYSDDLLAEEELVSTKQVMHLACGKNAQFGFVLSSPMFELKDGIREINIAVNLKIRNFYEVSYTGEKGWVSVNSVKRDSLVIAADQPAFVPYDSKIHGEGFESSYPLLKFTLLRKQIQRPVRSSKLTIVDTPKTGRFNASRLDASDINIQNINIKVSGSKDFQLKNDFGVIENKANMQPFGAQPLKESTLYVSSPFFSFFDSEYKPIINMNWSKSTLDNWKGNDSEKLPSLLQKGNDNTVFNLPLGIDFGWSDFSKKLYDSNATNGSISYPIAAPSCSSEITLDYEFQIKSFQTFVFSPFGVRADANLRSLELFDDEFERHLYIGVQNVSQGDSLNVYFHLDQTLCDSQISIDDNNLEWYYLSGNTWKLFENVNIAKDTTNAMRQSGIVCFKIADDAFSSHSIMPKDKIWIRMSIKKNGAAYPALKAVQSNALELSFDESSEGKPVLGYGLQSSTITKTVLSIPGVKAIQQPYEGEEGQYEEDASHFYTRVSERLRHKNRAWSAWDYERMLLEQFPTLAAVKCISCMNKNYEFAPGSVLVLLLPNCQNISQKNALQPKIGIDMVHNVESFLKEHSSPFADIHAINPVYKTITVECKLTLMDGYTDASYYGGLINRQLINFIAPWSDGDKNVALTNNQNTSQIAYFLEQLPYVNNIMELKVKLDNEEKEGDIIPSEAYTILTSAENHNVKIV